MIKLVQTPLGKVLLGMSFLLMSISLLGFGLPNMLSGGKPNVAKVGSFTIGINELNQEFQDDLRTRSHETGVTISWAEGLQRGMLEQSLARLILRRQMQQAALDAGVIVTDDTLATIIKNNKGFGDDDGKFSREKFEFVLKQAGLDPEDYADIVRMDTERGQMSMAVISGIGVPAIMLDNLREFEGRTRDISYVRITDDALPLDQQPTADELQEIYQQNIDTFKQPERRDVTVLAFGPADVAARVEVSDSDIKAEYERQRNNFQIGERRQFEQILMPGTTAAKQVAEGIKDGETLTEAAARILGDGAPQAIAVDWNEKGMLLPELADQVFSLKVGKTSAPIETGLGTYLVRVTGIQEAGVRPLADVRDAIKSLLQRQRASDLLFKVSAEVEEQLADENPLEDIAKAQSFKVVTLKGVDKDGQLADPKAQESGDMGLIAEEAFYQDQGDTSPLLEASQGGYLALRVDHVTPAVTLPLDQVKDQVVAIWRQLALRRLSGKISEQLVDTLNKPADNDWKDGFAAAGIAPALLKVERAEQLTRKGDGSKLPPRLISTVFRLEAPGRTDRLRIGDDWYVVRLESIASKALGKVEADELRGELKETLGFDLLSQYQRELDQRYPATVNYQTVNNYFKKQQ